MYCYAHIINMVLYSGIILGPPSGRATLLRLAPLEVTDNLYPKRTMVCGGLKARILATPTLFVKNPMYLCKCNSGAPF